MINPRNFNDKNVIKDLRTKLTETSIGQRKDIVKNGKYVSVKQKNKNAPYKTDKYEMDPIILTRRQKQIDYGKNTIGYNNYRRKIPINKRQKKDPRTPEKNLKYSRRGWDNLIKIWRLKLHHYDNILEGNISEDFVSEYSVSDHMSEDFTSDFSLSENFTTEYPITDCVSKESISKNFMLTQPVSEDIAPEYPILEDLVSKFPIQQESVLEKPLIKQESMSDEEYNFNDYDLFQKEKQCGILDSQSYKSIHTQKEYSFENEYNLNCKKEPTSDNNKVNEFRNNQNKIKNYKENLSRRSEFQNIFRGNKSKEILYHKNKFKVLGDQRNETQTFKLNTNKKNETQKIELITNNKIQIKNVAKDIELTIDPRGINLRKNEHQDIEFSNNELQKDLHKKIVNKIEFTINAPKKNIVQETSEYNYRVENLESIENNSITTSTINSAEDFINQFL